MNERDFCFWLNGLLELQPDLKTLNEAQVDMIRKHLGYVFKPTPTPWEADTSALQRAVHAIVEKPLEPRQRRDDTFC